MQRISITNPQNIIDGTAKKYYFKLRNTGGPKGDKGDKGDTGATGPQGPQGNAATVSVGSTTTLPVGYDATVANSGSIYNAVLDFGIPQGPQGPQGAKGDKGDTGAKGDTGPRGPQGERGTNATVSIGTTSTLNPGTQATVHNSGTDNNAVLNFGIPKGEKGDTGPMPTIAQTTGQAIDQVMSQKATTDALNAKQATITNSNKLSADLVTDTTTTNKFVTAEDKTTWNAKQNALTAGQGIDITSDVISTPALVPEVVASLPAEGTEGKLYLTPKAHTTSTATGNPITASVTEQAGTLESFKLDGDTFQQSYEGKNLYNATTAETTTKGLTFSGDTGFIYLNGTKTVNESVNWAKGSLPEGTYKLMLQLVSGSITSTSNGGLFYLYGSNITLSPSQLVLSSSNPKGSITLTVSESTTNAHLTLWARKTETYNNAVIRYQIVKGTADDYDFEPYVGGQPSPNPDYPQAVQTVTGENVVKICGKNLFNKNAITSGKYISNTGTLVDAASFAYSDYIPVIGGENYSYSGSTQTVTSDPPKGAWYDKDKNWISKQDYVQSGTITAPANAAYYRTSIRITASSTAQPYADTYQLELGSTSTAYEPYQGQSYEVNLGKNLYDKSSSTDGKRLDANGGEYTDSTFTLSAYIPVEPNTKYTLSGMPGSSYGHIATYDSSKTFVYRWYVGSDPFTFTTQANARYIRIATPLVCKDSTQCELGSTATSYAAYFTPIELCKIGTYQDYIYKNGGKWYVHKEVGKILSYAGETISTDYISTTGSLTTGATIYYVLATPTDTEITNQALVAQLEAILAGGTQAGANTITLTPSAGATGTLEVEYYDSYDSYLWVNNRWEKFAHLG